MVLWRCVLGDSGEQSVMTPGPTAVLELCASSWDCQVTVCGGLGELYVPLRSPLAPDHRCSDCTSELCQVWFCPSSHRIEQSEVYRE